MSNINNSSPYQFNPFLDSTSGGATHGDPLSEPGSGGGMPQTPNRTFNGRTIAQAMTAGASSFFSSIARGASQPNLPSVPASGGGMPPGDLNSDNIAPATNRQGIGFLSSAARNLLSRRREQAAVEEPFSGVTTIFPSEIPVVPVPIVYEVVAVKNSNDNQAEAMPSRLTTAIPLSLLESRLESLQKKEKELWKLSDDTLRQSTNSLGYFSTKELRQWNDAMKEWKKASSPAAKKEAYDQVRKLRPSVKEYPMLVGTSRALEVIEVALSLKNDVSQKPDGLFLEDHISELDEHLKKLEQAADRILECHIIKSDYGIVKREYEDFIRKKVSPFSKKRVGLSSEIESAISSYLAFSNNMKSRQFLVAASHYHEANRSLGSVRQLYEEVCSHINEYNSSN